MANDLLQHKDLFPKTVVDACRVLAGWRNFNTRDNNKMTDANDGVAFTTTSEQESNKKNRKKEITCFSLRKQGIMQMSVTRMILPRHTTKMGPVSWYLRTKNMKAAQMSN